MTNNFATLSRRLGLLLAVLAIFGAVAWNGWTFNHRQEVRTEFNALFVNNVSAGAPKTSEVPVVLNAAYAKVKASTQALERSMTFGAILVIGGLVAYGVGCCASTATRRRKQNGSTNLMEKGGGDLVRV